MATWRQMVYMVLDELKLISKDSVFTEDHTIFLLSKIRGMVLKQQYKDIKKEIPESNYQTICLNLVEVPAIIGECEGGSYLKSTEKIPFLLNISTPKVYTSNYFKGNISFISRERMEYVGYNKWLPNIIYASIGPDNYLYLKSFNPQYLYLDKSKIKFTGVFEDPEKVANLECNTNNSNCDILDKEFPLEEGLVPTVIDTVVKVLSGAIYKPSDSTNNASDDLSDIMAFVRRNMKSNLQKQIEE